MESQEDQEGYVAIPRALLQALAGESGAAYSFVLFVAQHTMGRQHKIGDKKYRVKEVCLSYDEFIHGRHKRDGTRMPETSGLRDDKAIGRGYQKALARGLVEVTQEGQRNVRVYTIPDRFWQAAGFEQAIQMLADNRIPDSWDAYTLVSTFTAGKMTADESEEAETEAPTAGKSAAVPGQNDSSQRNNASSSAAQMPADVSRQPAQDAAPQERKHTSQHRSFNIEQNIDAASATPSPPSISFSERKTEDEREAPAAAMTTGKPDAPLQAEERSESNDAPGRGKEDIPPAPTAELPTREQQIAEWERRSREAGIRSKIQVALITEETRLRAAIKKCEPGSAEAEELQRQQKNILNELDWYRREEA